MEFEVHQAINLEDGKYKGNINKIQYRMPPLHQYEYVDIIIKLSDVEGEVRYGCPANISQKSKLGQLIQQFTTLNAGEKIDPEKILLGKEVEFVIINEKNEKGTFYKVVDGSLKATVPHHKVD